MVEAAATADPTAYHEPNPQRRPSRQRALRGGAHFDRRLRHRAGRGGDAVSPGSAPPRQLRHAASFRRWVRYERRRESANLRPVLHNEICRLGIGLAGRARNSTQPSPRRQRGKRRRRGEQVHRSAACLAQRRSVFLDALSFTDLLMKASRFQGATQPDRLFTLHYGIVQFACVNVANAMKTGSRRHIPSSNTG
jgi:hypothetical protein